MYLLVLMACVVSGWVEGTHRGRHHHVPSSTQPLDLSTFPAHRPPSNTHTHQAVLDSHGVFTVFWTPDLHKKVRNESCDDLNVMSTISERFSLTFSHVGKKISPLHIFYSYSNALCLSSSVAISVYIYSVIILTFLYTDLDAPAGSGVGDPCSYSWLDWVRLLVQWRDGWQRHNDGLGWEWTTVPARSARHWGDNAAPRRSPGLAATARPREWHPHCAGGGEGHQYVWPTRLSPDGQWWSSSVIYTLPLT